MGHTARIECDCGSGKSRIVNHSPQGYSYFCFRCDAQEFVGKGKQTLAELARITALNDAAENIHLKIELPHDMSYEIPLEGRLWLYSAGVTESLWSSYKFGWSDYLQRVIMPVYNKEGTLIWFQARAVHEGQSPKYLNPQGDRNSLVFWSNRKSLSESAQNQTLVVVEDILSAIRVGEVTPTASLLGTKVSTAQASLLANYTHVTTWLDSDNAGVSGAYKLRRVLNMVTETSNLVTEKDPKLHTREEIRWLLNSDRHRTASCVEA